MPMIEVEIFLEGWQYGRTLDSFGSFSPEGFGV